MQALSLVYSSVATAPFDHAALQLLLLQARAHNLIAGITGLLLYRGQQFAQALQGPEPAVESLFARIQRDPRHRSINLLLKERVAEPSFQDWAMGYLPVDAGDDDVMVYSRAPSALIANGVWSQDAATRLIHHFNGALRDGRQAPP